MNFNRQEEDIPPALRHLKEFLAAIILETLSLRYVYSTIDWVEEEEDNSTNILQQSLKLTSQSSSGIRHSSKGISVNQLQSVFIKANTSWGIGHFVHTVSPLLNEYLEMGIIESVINTLYHQETQTKRDGKSRMRLDTNSQKKTTLFLGLYLDLRYDDLNDSNPSVINLDSKSNLQPFNPQQNVEFFEVYKFTISTRIIPREGGSNSNSKANVEDQAKMYYQMARLFLLKLRSSIDRCRMGFVADSTVGWQVFVQPDSSFHVPSNPLTHQASNGLRLVPLEATDAVVMDHLDLSQNYETASPDTHSYSVGHQQQQPPLLQNNPHEPNNQHRKRVVPIKSLKCPIIDEDGFEWQLEMVLIEDTNLKKKLGFFEMV